MVLNFTVSSKTDIYKPYTKVGVIARILWWIALDCTGVLYMYYKQLHPPTVCAPADNHLQYPSLLRSCLQDHSSLMYGLWQIKKNSSLCLGSMRRATCFSNRAKLRKRQRSTTMALLALKIYRWRLEHN